jgi:hypothetical protein
MVLTKWLTFWIGNDKDATLLTALREAVASGEANLLWMELWNIPE